MKTSLFALFLLSTTALSQAPLGTIYVESNIGDPSGGNSVIAYHRDDNGKLTLIDGYLTKGTGVHPVIPEATVATLATRVGPYNSDQSLALSPDGKRLYAVNSGSDTIAIFDVQTDGHLLAIKHSPFRSMGKNPVSLGWLQNGKFLAVVNKDYDLGRPGFDVAKRAPNYATFRINSRGQLLPIAHSGIVAERGGNVGPGYSNPTQALVAGNGTLMFDVDFFGYSIHSFQLLRSGRLQRSESQFIPPAEKQTFPPLDGVRALPMAVGMAAHPTAPVIYTGLVFDGRVALYYYESTGRMALLSSVAAGAGPCCLRINASGTRLYTSNLLGNSISVLDISNPYNPVKLQEFTLQSPPDIANGASPNGINLDPSGQYLYALTIKALATQSTNGNALHVLKLAADGTVQSQTDRVPLSVFPSLPQGITSF